MAGYGNYSFVIDSSFQPFTLQEMLVPFTAYKDVYDKSEEDYMKLTSEADKFKYLSETLPEDSRARQIYEGYANGLRAQAEDLAQNGLTMGNRRALTDYKRRYQGEIGRLVEADAAMKAEKELRRKTLAQDPSMLYALENFSVDDFLDNNTPNLYSVSGNTLYAKGAAAGKADSSRVFSAGDAGSTLGGYYRDYVQKLGYNADTIAKFRHDMSTIPALQQKVDDILTAEGVKDNLSGESLNRARQQVINGIIDGAVYQENHSPQRDLGVMSATEAAADARARQGLALQWAQFNESKRQHEDTLAASGYTRGKDGKLIYTGANNPATTVHELYQKTDKQGHVVAMGESEKKKMTDLYLQKFGNSDYIGAIRQRQPGMGWEQVNVGNGVSTNIGTALQIGERASKGKVRFLSAMELASLPPEVQQYLNAVSQQISAMSGDIDIEVARVQDGTETSYAILKKPNK